MSVASFSRTVPARAALAGNPSDGHGGAVVATLVPSLAATVSARQSSQFEFDGFSDRFESVGEISEWIDHGTFDADQPLIHAALAVLYRRFGVDLRTHAFQVTTTIPRSLGLAGSSAIVVAAIRTMVDAHRDDPWARELADRPELIASLALEAERDLLGIAAGLQDRVAQALGGTVAMEFGGEHMHTLNGLDIGSYRLLGQLPAGMFVAYRLGTAGDSGLVHAGVDPADPAFSQAMRRAAEAGRAAADAIDASDAGALGAAMDETFDQRAAVFPLDPAHVEMVDVARSNGASANYTGSGGSIIVMAPDGRAAAALGELGCEFVSL